MIAGCNSECTDWLTTSPFITDCRFGLLLGYSNGLCYWSYRFLRLWRESSSIWRRSWRKPVWSTRYPKDIICPRGVERIPQHFLPYECCLLNKYVQVKNSGVSCSRPMSQNTWSSFIGGCASIIRLYNGLPSWNSWKFRRLPMLTGLHLLSGGFVLSDGQRLTELYQEAKSMNHAALRKWAVRSQRIVASPLK